MHVEHKAGDKMFIDYTGEKLYVIDPSTGEMKAMDTCHLPMKGCYKYQILS